MDGECTLSVYVAAPGRPLMDGGTSAAGHVYYGIAHESDRKRSAGSSTTSSVNLGAALTHMVSACVISARSTAA